MGGDVRRRVAVTGMGVVSPIGSGVASFRESLLEGRSGAATISVFDATGLPTRIAAEVRWQGEILRDRKVSFALEAARQAMAAGGRPQGQGGLSLGIGLELFSMEDLAASVASNLSLPPSRQERLP